MNKRPDADSEATVAKDLEDRASDDFDAFIWVCIRFCSTFAWPVAERAFKLVSWALVIAALHVVYAKTHSGVVITVEVALITLLFVAAAVASFQVVSYLQDQILEKGHTLRLAHPLLFWLSVLLFLCVSALPLMVLVRVGMTVFIAILSVYGTRQM